jgi:hypothetical protein
MRPTVPVSQGGRPRIMSWMQSRLLRLKRFLKFNLYVANMKQDFLLLLSVIILLACVPIQEAPLAEHPAKEEVKVSEEGAAPPSEPKVVGCTDSDNGDNPNVKGKAVLTYDNGQKESLDDKCLGLNFQLEYLCEGNTAKTINNKCPNACEKGVCS